MGILSFALGREGYEILRANDGLAGVQLAEEQSPDMIVLDLAFQGKNDMPTMGNLVTCQCLRENGITAPILVFTGSANEQEQVENAGADDYIKKPFSMRNLLSKTK